MKDSIELSSLKENYQNSDTVVSTEFFAREQRFSDFCSWRAWGEQWPWIFSGDKAVNKVFNFMGKDALSDSASSSTWYYVTAAFNYSTHSLICRYAVDVVVRHTGLSPTADTSLWSTTVCDQGGVCAIDPNQLLPDMDDIWVNLLLMHVGELDVWLYHTECRGEFYEQASYYISVASTCFESWG